MLSWVKRAVVGESDRPQNYVVSDPDTDDTMVEILLSEVETFYAEKSQQYYAERRSTSSLQFGGADYSWLISDSVKQPKLSEKIRTEVIMLADSVNRDEYNRVIRYFRARAERADSGEDVLQAFRRTVEEVTRGRPRKVSIPEWIMSQLSRSRPGSTKAKNGPNQVCATISFPSTSTLSFPSTFGESFEFDHGCPGSPSEQFSSPTAELSPRLEEFETELY